MLTTDNDILKAAEDWRKAGRAVALATVVETWGSAPRPVGSNLVIDEDGNFLGSVSGGCVEGRGGHRGARRDRQRQAENAGIRRRRRDRLEGRAVLRRHHPGFRREGGVVKLDILSALNTERAARRAAIVVTDERSGLQRLVKAAEIGNDRCGRCWPSVCAPAGAAWSKPRRAASSSPSMCRRRSSSSPAPSISARRSRRSRGSLGYDVTIVDPRTAFASIERFPDVKVIAEWPDQALPPLGIDRYTAFVALTHDPKIDDPALIHALARDCFYIGALGSKKTHARRVERLKQQGLTDADISRIHAPIGLDIGAVSPAEIAVAIIAQITERLREEPQPDRAPVRAVS